MSKLRRAILSARPGQPGYEYVEACEFIARWVIGNAVHTGNLIERQSPRARVVGTEEHAACIATISECTNTELQQKVTEVGRIAAVVLSTRLFITRTVSPRSPNKRFDVLDALYDGALVKIDQLGESPDEVDECKRVFDLLIMPVAGSA